MRENTYQIEVGDYERRTLIGILAECRNECLKRETPTEDVNNLLEKALDAPLKNRKGKDRDTDHKLNDKHSSSPHSLYSIGFVSLAVLIAVISITSAVMARTNLPTTEYISISYHSWLMKYKSGILATVIATIR